MKEKRDYTKRFVRGSAIVFVITMATVLVNYLVRLLFARKMSVEDYGLFYAVFTLISFLLLFEKLGLGEALAKLISEFKVKNIYSSVNKSIMAILIIQLILGLFLAVFLFIFSDFLAINYFHTSKASLLLKAFSAFLIFRPFSTLHTSAFLGMQKMKLYASVDFVRGILVLVFSYFGFYFGKGAIIPTIAYLVMSFILPLLFTPALLKMLPKGPKEQYFPDKQLFNRLFKYGITVFFASICMVILDYTDTIMLTFFSGLKEVGLYNVALPVAKFLSYFGLAVSSVVLPFTSELWTKKNRDILKEGVELIHKYSFIGIIPFAMVMFSFPDVIIRILFGSDYVAGAPALRVLSIGVTFLAVSSINGNILLGIGKPKEFTKIVLISSLLNVLLNLALIPRYGMLGAAIATSISFFFMFVLTISKLERYVSVKISLLAWTKNLVIAVTFVIIVTFLKKWITLEPWPELIIISVISFTMYLGLVFLFRLTTFEEVRTILRRVIV